MLRKTFLILFLPFFVVITLFGVGVSMTADNGDMTGCPLMEGLASMCQMGVLEHIGYWQQLFTAKVNDANTLILWLLSILLLFAVYQLGIRNRGRVPFDSSFYLYNKSNPQVRLFNYLNLLFSRGILHPKIY